MIKNILSVFALAGALVMASCSSQPSDLRPEVKVSDDSVPPGMRNNTANFNNAEEDEGDRKDVLINHDEHATDIDTKTQGTPATQESSSKGHVENHE